MGKHFNTDDIVTKLRQQIIDKGTEKLKYILLQVGSSQEQDTAIFKFNDEKQAVEISGISEETNYKIILELRKV